VLLAAAKIWWLKQAMDKLKQNDPIPNTDDLIPRQ